MSIRGFFLRPAVSQSSSSLRGGVAGSILTALVALPVLANAQPGAAPPPETPEQVELQYVGGARCPTKATFVREVAARIRRPIEWVVAGGATQITVSVEEADGYAAGRLDVVRRGTDPTRREFMGSSCTEVSSALALVAALTLDPNARTERLAPGAGSPEATESATAETAPAPAPAPAPTPAAAPQPPPSSSPARARVLASPPPSTERLESPPSRYRVWLGPTAGVAGGYAPEPLITLGASLGARAAERRGFSPSFQLTALWGKTGVTGPSAPDGAFAWAMARLEACPVQLPLATPLALEACLAGEVGRLSARGAEDQIDEPVTADRWWAAGGVAVSLHFSSGRWFLRLGTQAIFPATRDKFVFRDPDRTVHQASWLSYGASAGFGFELGQ
jgi:hypothetical protein